ncbi:hypothetical protein QBC38DRAFT_541776, partial [Podospora fimiseda]
MSNTAPNITNSNPPQPGITPSFVINPPKIFVYRQSNSNLPSHIHFVVALQGVSPGQQNDFFADATLEPVDYIQEGPLGGQQNVRGHTHREDLLRRPDNQNTKETIIYFIFNKIQPTATGNFKLSVQIRGPNNFHTHLTDELMSTVMSNQTMPEERIIGLLSSGQMRVFTSLLPEAEVQRLPAFASGRRPFDIQWNTNYPRPPRSIAINTPFPEFVFQAVFLREALSAALHVLSCRTARKGFVFEDVFILKQTVTHCG